MATQLLPYFCCSQHNLLQPSFGGKQGKVSKQEPSKVKTAGFFSPFHRVKNRFLKGAMESRVASISRSKTRWCVLLLLAFLAREAPAQTQTRLPVVYVYTVGIYSCKQGIPSYITTSLEQALLQQPDCDVIMASNYKECSTVEAVIDRIPGIIKYDISTEMGSNRTKEFANLTNTMFEANFNGELWATSAVRFFSLEDLMIQKGYREMVHVEADNLLYGKMTDLLPAFRSKYKGLAATPLNSNKSFITASVLWIAGLAALQKFNDFLLGLGRDKREWQKYLDWLRPYGCCMRGGGGVDPDKNGNGIKPFAINEMSMLAYYHHLEPKEFYLFPVVPHYAYVMNKYICNLTDFGPLGTQLPGPTGRGIWDPNSYGQFLGGTSRYRGRDKGFTDASHIAGQAMRTNGCKPKMVCSNVTIEFPSTATNGSFAGGGKYCYTAPFVHCADDPTWTPLWNLHVHAKHTKDYKSEPCPCPAALSVGM